MPPGEGVASREEGCRRGASFLFPHGSFPLVFLPEKGIVMQRNWIGPSEGVRIQVLFAGSERTTEIFTTWIDTIYGATFALLPRDPFVRRRVHGRDRRPGRDGFRR